VPDITEIQEALDGPKGKRALDPILREAELHIVNYGEFISRTAGNYLHHKVGGFAVVYHLRDDTGCEAALRCWKKSPPADTVGRAKAITQFLQSNPMPYFVDQQYFADALLVRGVYYPVILMDWVSGRSLREVVEKMCAGRDADALNALADRIEEMVYAMQDAGIAHGDLQHDNILIQSDGMARLVDYDSIYLPGLNAQFCDVAGMAGYGHPDYIDKIVRRPLNDKMDTFAGIVLLLSLRAFHINPNLFGKYSNENLLFRAEDLENPDSSPVFAELRSLSVPKVTDLCDILVGLCKDRNLAETTLRSLLGSRRRTISSRIVLPNIPNAPASNSYSKIAADEFAFLFTEAEKLQRRKTNPQRLLFSSDGQEGE